MPCSYRLCLSCFIFSRSLKTVFAYRSAAAPSAAPSSNLFATVHRKRHVVAYPPCLRPPQHGKCSPEGGRSTLFIFSLCFTWFEQTTQEQRLHIAHCLYKWEEHAPKTCLKELGGKITKLKTKKKRLYFHGDYLCYAIWWQIWFALVVCFVCYMVSLESAHDNHHNKSVIPLSKVSLFVLVFLF